MRHQAYLDRIGLTESPSGAEGLRKLQAAHMATIVFENIDPLLGRVPDLTPTTLEKKLVSGSRGGYCFELNGLLGPALQELGYRATPILARVRNGASHGGARTHQAFVVELDGKDWLVDVGFGGPGPLWPLDLQEPNAQEVPNGVYRIRWDESVGETVLERAQGGDWFSLYGFDLVPVRSLDIEAANYLAATWEKAPFSTNLMMAKHGPEGRMTVFNRRVQKNGVADILNGPEELAETLRGGFALVLDDEDIAAVWNRIRDLPTVRSA